MTFWVYPQWVFRSTHAIFPKVPTMYFGKTLARISRYLQRVFGISYLVYPKQVFWASTAGFQAVAATSFLEEEGVVLASDSSFGDFPHRVSREAIKKCGGSEKLLVVDRYQSEISGHVESLSLQSDLFSAVEKEKLERKQGSFDKPKLTWQGITWT